MENTIHLIAAGDILIHDACIEAAYDQVTGRYDFYPMLQYLEPILKPADIAICNLETTISGEDKKFSGYPRFNAPESLLKAIRDVGFTIVSTANNHSVDYGEYGILSTIAALQRNGLKSIGTSLSGEPDIRNLLIRTPSIVIGINAYTYGTNENPVPSDRQWLINMINFDLIASDIKFMRDNGADIIVICLHAGEEYLMMPDTTQIEYVKKLQALGVDIILGNHPHIVQPAIFDSQNNNYIIYSLGNLLSNQRDTLRDTGIIVDIELTRNNDSIVFSNVKYHPTYVHRWEQNGRYEFRVVPLLEYEKIGKSLPDFPFEKAAYLLKHITEHIYKPV